MYMLSLDKMKVPLIAIAALGASSVKAQETTSNITELCHATEGLLSYNREIATNERLTRFEDAVSKFAASKLDLKLRFNSGLAGNSRQFIATYNDQGIRLIGLFEDRSDGNGFSGIDLRLKQLRINLGQGEDRKRASFTLYGENHSFLGYTEQKTGAVSDTSLFGGATFGKDESVEATITKSGASRFRVLHKDSNYQASATIGRGMNGETVGNASWNNRSTWISVQGAQSKPTSYRLTFGDIDAERSQRAFSVTDSGQNELLAPDPTFRFTMGEDPTFNLARGLPGKYLGTKPGAKGFEVFYTAGKIIEATTAMRLDGKKDLFQPYISSTYKRNFDERSNTFGVEAGGSFRGIGGAELRMRIEYRDRDKRTAIGLLLTTRL